MRYLRYAFLGTLGVLLISVSMANRDIVTLRLMPDVFADFLNWNAEISLPLFLVVLGGIVAGLVIGFVWEWFREYRHRKDASVKGREVRRLEREVTRLKGETAEGQDEVLALLDKAS